MNEQSKDAPTLMGELQRADNFRVELRGYKCRYSPVTGEELAGMITKVDFPVFFAQPQREEREDPIQSIARKSLRDNLRLDSASLIRLHRGNWDDARIQQLAARHGITSTQWYTFKAHPIPEEGELTTVPGDIVNIGLAFLYNPDVNMRQLIADLKFQELIVFQLLDSAGDVAENWLLSVQQLVEVRYGGFDYASDKPLTVAVTFRCEVLDAPEYQE